jgi:hypothetical protein
LATTAAIAAASILAGLCCTYERGCNIKPVAVLRGHGQGFSSPILVLASIGLLEII